MRLSLKTVSRNLLEGLDDRIEAIAFYNFESGKRKYSLEKFTKLTIGVQDITWIRVYVKGNFYYDFITSSVTYVLTKSNLVVIANDDSELIDVDYISKLIIKSSGESEKNIMNESTADGTLAKYYEFTREKMKKASEELEKFYSVSSQSSSSRLNLQDTYKYGKSKLEREYVIDLMTKQIIKENRQEILEVI